MNPTRTTPRPDGQGPGPLRTGADDGPSKAKRPKPRGRPENGAGSFGGLHRHRTGGGMRTIGGGLKLVPEDLLRGAAGYRFPADRETPRQLKAFESLLTDYLRRDFVYRFEDLLPAGAIAAALGLSERKVAYLIKEVRAQDCRPEADLIVAVLHGMFTGTLAGALGMRHNQKTRLVLGMVDRLDLTDEDMRDRLSIGDHGGWADDDEYRRNCRFFAQLQSAFRLDYLRWRDK